LRGEDTQGRRRAGRVGASNRFVSVTGTVAIGVRRGSGHSDPVRETVVGFDTLDNSIEIVCASDNGMSAFRRLPRGARSSFGDSQCY
jgi:hypothetical protein